jgi:hypothetical protein
MMGILRLLESWIRKKIAYAGINCCIGLKLEDVIYSMK